MYYSSLPNNRAVWNNRPGWNFPTKLINVQGGIRVDNFPDIFCSRESGIPGNGFLIPGNFP